MFNNITSLLNSLDSVAKDTLEESTGPRISATSLRSLRRQATDHSTGEDKGDDHEVSQILHPPSERHLFDRHFCSFNLNLLISDIIYLGHPI